MSFLVLLLLEERGTRGKCLYLSVCGLVHYIIHSALVAIILRCAGWEEVHRVGISI
jgi:hypothetical protein